MRGGHPRVFKRNTLYWFRAKVPRELVKLIGKTEFRQSLRTSSYADACRLARRIGTEVDDEIERAREQLKPRPVTVLANSQVSYFALRWLYDADRHSSENRTLAGHAYLHDDEYEEQLRTEISTFSDTSSHATAQAVDIELRELARKERLVIEAGNPASIRLRQLLARAMAQHALNNLKRLKGDYSKDRDDAFFSDLDPTVPLVAQRPITFGQLTDEYEAERPDARSPKTGPRWATHRAFAEELIGTETPLNEITRARIIGIRDLLIRLPAHARKLYPKLSYRDAAARAQLDGHPAMDPITANPYLVYIFNLLEHARNVDYLDRNVANKIRVVPKFKSKEDKRTIFEIEELQAIFSAPIYTGCMDDEQNYAVPGINHPRRGRFWVPLIALFSAMRQEEICQLHVSDIVQSAGVMTIKVSGSGDRRVKTAAAERLVPIHPELVKIGLLQYVEQARARGDDRLFSELSTSKTGGLGDNFSKWFRRFRIKAGVSSPRKVFHSFRHTFRDALREADISVELASVIGGWSRGTTEARYGEGFRADKLAEAIGRVQYPGLSLRHLYTELTDPNANP